MENGNRPLPEGWRWARLGDVCEVVNGFGFAEYLQGKRNLPYPFVKVSDMNAAGPESVVKGAANTVDDQILRTLGARTYPPGTVIFPKVGGALLTNKKRVLGVEACFDNNVMGLVPRTIVSQWVFYWMLTVDLRNLSNTQALPSIRQSRIAALEIPVPPTEEQKRIAAILNEEMAAVERARTAAEAQLEAAKALPAAYLRAVFQSPEAQRWPRRLLNEISEITGGIQKTPDRKPTAFHRPYLTVRNVQRGFLDLSQVERFEVTPAELSRLCLRHGDILIVEGNGSRDHIGRNALFIENGEEWIHQNHIIRVRLFREVCLPEFVSRFLNSGQGRQQMLEKAKTTSGLYTLSAGKVGSLEVPAPSLPEQQRIAATFKERIDSAEQMRKTIEEELNATNKLPAALLRRAFNGEL